MERTEKTGRLASLDALRGFDMLFIMGLSPLIVSVCNLFPGGGDSLIALNMGHAKWDGFYHHDTIFPLFLFKGLEDFEPRYLSYEVWTPIICLAILCSSMAFSLWVNTIKHLGVAKSSIFTALIPVASALSAWALGYEFLTMRQWGGVLLSAVGVIMSQYCMKQQK